MNHAVQMELDPLEEHLLAALRALPTGEGEHVAEAEAIWRAQVRSRLCDFAARSLKDTGRSFYSIGSAGHESNAAVAVALRPTDPALLHYRSGAFYLARAAQAGRDGVPDILMGMTAAREEPIAGGRHKVFGNHELAVIPQTSTIASHLPRAIGVAFAIERAKRLGVDQAWLPDAVVVCSFGDASVNHAAAQAGLNSAAHLAYQGLPLPLLFVCEDNGLGISVRSPQGWVESALRARPSLRYESVSGDDPEAVLETAEDLAAWIRERRAPAVLHLRVVRYLSHAGADVEAAYRTPQEIRADWDADPLLATARWLGRPGDELADEYLAERERVLGIAREAAALPQLESAAEVMRPLAPRTAGPVAASAGDEPMTVAQAVNAELADALERDPKVLVFGEDVAVKGGVYGVTRGLQKRFGAARVFDTLLDETSILGLALGTAVSGLLPVPEIQYLAYLHNAEDQLRGEAATLQFFSQGRYRNGMVVRIAGLGYQRGFGGHFHNDDAIGVLRDIPGLVIASPGRPDDAARDARAPASSPRASTARSASSSSRSRSTTRATCTRRATRAGSRRPPARRRSAPARVHGDGGDLTIVTWANGLRMSLRVARRLEARGVRARVRRSALARPAAGRRPAPRGGRDRPRARRRRDPADRRRLGGRDRGARRRGVRGQDRACGEQGLVHPARRCVGPRPRLGARDRGRRTRARPTAMSSRPPRRLN